MKIMLKMMNLLFHPHKERKVMYTEILLNVGLTVLMVFATGACCLAMYLFWREIKEGNL